MTVTLGHNPFGRAGKIVVGSDFWHRQSEVDALFHRLVNTAEASNVAIVGLPCIGKSSLLAEVSRRFRFDLEEKNRLWAAVRFSSCESAEDFFHLLVRTVERQLASREGPLWSIGRLPSFESVAFKGTWVELTDAVWTFFEGVRSCGLQPIIVLDEFDHARQLFRGRTAPFQLLRELCYQPSTRAALVTASRRPVAVIEGATEAISTLDGIANPLWLGPFSAPEAAEMFDRIVDVSGYSSSEQRNEVAHLAGRHPHILAFTGNYLWEASASNAPFEAGLAKARRKAAGYFDRVLTLVSELDGGWTAIGQCIGLRPGPSVPVSALTTLEAWGVVDTTTEEVFSAAFLDTVSQRLREREPHGPYEEAELLLRNLVDHILSDKLGYQWEVRVAECEPRTAHVLDEARERRAVDLKRYPSSASRRLLDYTYLRDLFDIVHHQWPWFAPTLGGHRSDWDGFGKALCAARNADSHMRPLDPATEALALNAAVYIIERLGRGEAP